MIVRIIYIVRKKIYTAYLLAYNLLNTPSILLRNSTLSYMRRSHSFRQTLRNILSYTTNAIQNLSSLTKKISRIYGGFPV